jgi:hypothetical protein
MHAADVGGCGSREVRSDMLTLLKREIEDYFGHFLTAALIAAIGVATLVVLYYADIAEMVEATAPLAVCYALMLCIGCCSVGAIQVYGDRANRVSPFLATLATTRRRILAARIIAGLLAIATALAPVCVAAIVVLYKTFPFMTLYTNVMVEVIVTVSLLALACYGIGLQIGWASGKVLAAVECLVCPATLLTLVIIKGFDAQIMAVLGVLILACMLRAWAKTVSTPL